MPDAPLLATDGVFLDHLEACIALARGGEGRRWNRMRVHEEALTPANWGGRHVDHGPAGDYEPRWREVLTRVDRNWVNIRLDGVRDGELQVLVEYYDSGTPGHTDWPVAVTYGGNVAPRG